MLSQHVIETSSSGIPFLKRLLTKYFPKSTNQQDFPLAQDVIRCALSCMQIHVSVINQETFLPNNNNSSININHLGEEID